MAPSVRPGAQGLGGARRGSEGRECQGLGSKMALVDNTNGIPFWGRCNTCFSLFWGWGGIGMFTGGTGF